MAIAFLHIQNQTRTIQKTGPQNFSPTLKVTASVLEVYWPCASCPNSQEISESGGSVAVSSAEFSLILITPWLCQNSY